MSSNVTNLGISKYNVWIRLAVPILCREIFGILDPDDEYTQGAGI
jgi:hypothetical protein